jgi:hypothetical protein
VLRLLLAARDTLCPEPAAQHPPCGCVVWRAPAAAEDVVFVLHCSGRVIKAALAAGFYPSLLRVDHPPARFRATEGGAVQVRF